MANNHNKIIGFRLPEDVRVKVEKEAQRAEVSISEVCRRVLIKHYTRRKRK